jgi:hypothetical protein
VNPLDARAVVADDHSGSFHWAAAAAAVVVVVVVVVAVEGVKRVEVVVAADFAVALVLLVAAGGLLPRRTGAAEPRAPRVGPAAGVDQKMVWSRIALCEK